MKIYLSLNQLEIEKASAYNNYYCLGAPALTTYSGLVDKIKRIIEVESKLEVTEQSFSVVMHKYNFNEGREKHIAYMNIERGNIKKGGFEVTNVANKEEFTCDINISLFITFDLKDNSDDLFGIEEESINILDYEDIINNELHTIKFLGGNLLNQDRILKIHTSKESFIKEFYKMKPGFFIVDNSKEFSQYIEAFEGDSLKALVYCCTLFEQESIPDGKTNPVTSYKKAMTGWIAPTNFGYVRLHKKALLNNTGLRDMNTEAYFVEPLTGLIKYEFSKRIIKKFDVETLLDDMLNANIVFKPSFDNEAYIIKNLNEKENENE